MNNDLISRSALLRAANAEEKRIGRDWDYDALKTAIELAPAVDAELVRHGYCDFCGRGKPIKAYTILPDCGLQYGISVTAKYCPICGKSMDAKEG